MEVEEHFEPARLLDELPAGGLGRPLFVVQRSESTMDEARALWRRGAPHGSCVIAEEQRRGRGRRGRSFVSPRGGLYLTVLTVPCGPPATAWRVGLAAALAIREGLLGLGGPALGIEWPNDLMHEGRKVGGLLAEWLAPYERSEPAVALGIGLNLGPDPAAIDPQRAGPAGPLPLPFTRHRRERVAAAVLRRLDAVLGGLSTEDGWADTVQSLRSVLVVGTHQRVVLRLPDGSQLVGSPLELQLDGSLLVARDDGTTVVVRHAERWIE